MIAWVSGSADQAVLQEGERYLLLSYEETEPDRPLELSHLTNFTRDWRDLYSVEVATREAAHAELRKASDAYHALLLTSLVIDRNVEHGEREIAVAEAERLLADSSIYDYVLGVYCAQPMPPSADLREGAGVCRQRGFARIGEVIGTVLKFEENISAANQAWQRIGMTPFGNQGRRAAIQATAVRLGLFLAMVKRIGDAKRCETFPDVLESLVAPFTLSQHPELPAVMRAWTQHAREFCPPPSPPVPLFAPQATPRARVAGRVTDAVGVFGHTGVSARLPAFA